MVFGDRLPVKHKRWIREEDSMTEPLHTDDPEADGNVSAEEYQRQHEERAARLGDAGLHTIPDAVLAKALEDIDGADR